VGAVNQRTQTNDIKAQKEVHWAIKIIIPTVIGRDFAPVGMVDASSGIIHSNWFYFL